jgi:FAD-linked sulfhydryl oxidase
MQALLESLAHLLPCKECKEHFMEIINKYPPDLSNSCAFQTWLFNAHNMVNKRLGKPIFTTDQYAKRYAESIKVHKENMNKERTLY